MKLEKNNYKILKTKKYIKNNNFFFIFNGHVNTKNLTLAQQNFLKFNLNSYKIYNTLTKTILKNSIYTNYSFMVRGSMIFVTSMNKKIDLKIKKLIDYSNRFKLICLKLNHKIYSFLQIKSITNLNFKKNIFIFCTTIRRSLKMSTYKLKKI